MTFIYRTFLIGLLGAIVWYSYVKHIESRDRSVRVQDLRDCFERRSFAPGVPPQNVQKSFMQALVRLHESMLSERTLGWWRNKEITLEWYLEAAIAGLEANDTEASLIRRALQQAYYELQRQDQLEDYDLREKIRGGKPPVCTQGNFVGDALVVGFHVSPVIVPQLRNHPGNFVLQPATVWALQQDIVEKTDFGMIREFHNAGLLPNDFVEALTEQHFPKKRQSGDEKND